MEQRRVSEAELAEALQRALFCVSEELGGDRAISADVYCDCLVGLFIAASPQPESPDELERLVALFRDKLTAALARRGVAGRA